MEVKANIVSEKLMVYPKRQNLVALLSLCALIALISALSFFTKHYITGIIFGLIFCFMVLMASWRKDLKPKLIIDFNGIRLNNIFISNWIDLKNIEICTYYDSDGLKREKLIVDRFDIELDDLEVNIYDLERIIKMYRLKK